MMHKPSMLAVVVAGLLGSGLVVASAAGLGTVSGGIFSAAGPVTYDEAVRSVSDLVLTSSGSPATVSALTLTVSGPDLASLDGQNVTVALLDSAGAQVRLVTATLVAGANLTVGASTASVVLAVSGNPPLTSFASWAVFVAGVQVLGPLADPTLRTVTTGAGTFVTPVTPLNWQSLLVSAGNTDTMVESVVLTTATTVQQCVTIGVMIVQTVGNNPRTWTLAFDFGAGPFWGTPPNRIENATVQSTVGTVHTLVGISPDDRRRRNDPPLYIVVCQDNAPSAPHRPEAYTVSGQTRGTWTSEQACVRKTVTGNGAYPFYFGWSVPLNLAPAFAKLRETDPGAPRSFGVHPNTVTPAFDAIVTSYTVTNLRDTAIAGTQSRVVELCASRF